jgi:hypothetical protein
MRRDVVLAALLLPLSGCYAPQPAGYAQPAAYPPGYQYAQPGYQQPGYPQPGYPQPGYDPSGEAYPGYSENGGDPTLLVEGATVPLILYGGGWGYWDSRHSWHHAPDEVSRHLERERAGGFHRGGEGFGQQRPEGRPPGGAPNGGQNFFHANDQGRPPPAGAPNGGQNSFHANDQGRPPPARAPNGGQNSSHANDQARPPPAGAPSGGQNFFHAN